MDTCVGGRIAEYLLCCILARRCVLSNIININCPDGATYSQTVYVLKYAPRARLVFFSIVGS